MAGWLYSATTVFGVILIGFSLALQMLYIGKYQNDENAYFLPQLGSQIVNTLVVGYLIIMIAFFRPYSSTFAIVGTCTLLLIGLTLEFVTDQFELNTGGYVGAYMLTVANAIFRLFLLVQIRCDAPSTTIADVINQIGKVAATTGRPVSDIQKQIAPSLETMDPMNTYKTIMNGLSGIDLGDKREAIKDSVKKSLAITPKTGGRR
jgi:hypothetical protein